jgi:cytoskeleton protein RodZ
LPSFGEKLRLEREKRKISLEQISASTKIGTRMLQALEEDKFNQLPGGIFNKGFVRAYSHFIGLDEDQTVAEYLQASGDAPPVRTEIGPDEDEARSHEENIRRLDSISDTPSRPLPWGLFAALLLFIALALSLWTHRQRERAKQSVQPAPAITTAPLPAVGGGAPIKTDSKDANRTGASITKSPTPVSTSGETASAAAPGQFTVTIQAREDCWISITADGQATASELLAAGTARTIRGRKEIAVKAGNAGGIDFRFNDKKIKIGGESGEVKIITFGPGGLVPSALAPASAP